LCFTRFFALPSVPTSDFNWPNASAFSRRCGNPVVSLPAPASNVTAIRNWVLPFSLVSPLNVYSLL